MTVPARTPEPWLPTAPKRAIPLACLLACCSLFAQAQTSAPASANTTPEADRTLTEVQVRTERSTDEQARRESSVAKQVIGREELDRQGDASVSEVLKRQPGITLSGSPGRGRGGNPQMRGMGAYTQILLDGQPLPPGLSLDSLSPSAVERIEILRAPTAETGARAVAGTINIVLREKLKAEPDDLKLTASSEHGQPATGLDWTHHFKTDSLQGLTSLSLNNTQSRDETWGQTLRDDGNTTQETEHNTSDGKRSGLHAMARLQWQGEPGESLTLTPFAVYAESSGHGQRSFTQSVNGGPAATDTASTESGARYGLLRLNGQWNRRLGADGRLETRFGASDADYRSHTNQTAQNGLLPDLQEQANFTDRTWSASSKWTQVWREDHLLVSGVEWERTRRQDDGNSASGADNVRATTQRLALYAQDEWNLNPQWGAHAGLRYERIGTDGQLDDGPRRNTSAVWSPLLHAVWKPLPDSRDQVRASLTRSYKSPTLYNLVSRTVYSHDVNSPTDPDRRGNPDLKPELATGLDLAYEHYLAEGGVLSASAFYRDISDLIRYLTAYDTGQGRWVSTPRNVGDAVSTGLEFDAKFRLNQLWAAAPAVDLRGNASFFRSRVKSVPGPDNRLDRQPSRTLNLGADYRLRTWPLTVGGTFSHNPAYDTRLSEEQTAYRGMKRSLDLYGLWRFSPSTALRLSVSNASPTDSISGRSYSASTLAETSTTQDRNWRSVQLRLELKL